MAMSNARASLLGVPNEILEQILQEVVLSVIDEYKPRTENNHAHTSRRSRRLGVRGQFVSRQRFDGNEPVVQTAYRLWMPCSMECEKFRLEALEVGRERLPATIANVASACRKTRNMMPRASRQAYAKILPVQSAIELEATLRCTRLRQYQTWMRVDFQQNFVATPIFMDSYTPMFAEKFHTSILKILRDGERACRLRREKDDYAYILNSLFMVATRMWGSAETSSWAPCRPSAENTVNQAAAQQLNIAGGGDDFYEFVLMHHLRSMRRAGRSIVNEAFGPARGTIAKAGMAEDETWIEDDLESHVGRNLSVREQLRGLFRSLE
ncbi:MAG: hypothetical protein M1828_005573 [Chrysothrix sp. TS-e1954]|nr:MAG: hypothetical protein M1828_005573 [Chrysothrix sp. TS-e1954]